MGVDKDTYRGRIGSFNNRFKLTVNVTDKTAFNFGVNAQCIGSVVFIGLLLVLAGIEQNPGPLEKDKPPYERVLSKSLPDLVDKLKPKPLIDFLVSKEVLSHRIARDINEQKTTSDVIRSLICYVRTRGSSLYFDFKEGLQKTEQNEILQNLEILENELDKERKAELTSDDSDSDQEYSDALLYIRSKFVQRDPDVDKILQRFGLLSKMEHKIQVSDVVQLDFFRNEDKRYDDQDIPLVFLQQILYCKSDAFNYKSYVLGDQNITKGSVNSLFAPDEANDVSPLDLFVLVYQCCDQSLQ